MIEITSNGKLYITGEYNVLNKKGQAILLGVNRHINFKVKQADKFSYIDNNIKELFSFDDGKIRFSNGNDRLVKLAITESFNYLKNIDVSVKPFSISIESDLMNDEGIKYGLGSSGAVITGTIKSILAFHNIELDPYLIFKIAVITKVKAEEFSSGGDLASSMFEGLIYYRRYNKKWLLKNIDNKNIYQMKWKDLKIKQIESNYTFGAVWTKESYKTLPLTYKISKKEYKYANRLVKHTLKSIISKDYASLKENIKLYQNWLEVILAKDNLVTEKLDIAIKIAKEHHLTAKISGAGGGDSIIVLIPEGYDLTAFNKTLIENDLEFLEI